MVQKLKAAFFTPLIITALMVIAFETDLITPAAYINPLSGTEEFVFLYLLEIITIIIVPIALKMMHASKIHSLIHHNKSTYYHLALLRIAMIGIPMIVNTLMYYITMTTTYCYLTLILIAADMFIIPSAQRCANEMNSDHNKQ